MAQSAVDRLIGQLQTIKTVCKLVYSNDPAMDARATAAIAQYFASCGTTNLLDLKRYVNAAADLSFVYDISTAFVYPQKFLLMNIAPTLSAQESAGPLLKNAIYAIDLDKTQFYFFLVFTTDGYPVVVATGKPISSDWHDFFQGVVFVASIAVSFAFPALGAQIGSAVMGAEAAAAYPAVASAVGNIAVQTALNGGDIQSAVVGSLAGGVGSSVGGVVATATDSAIIGAAAAAATRAAITGGNLTQAVAGSLIKNGVNALDTGALFTGGSSMSLQDDIFDTDGQFGDGAQTTIDPITGQIGVSFPADANGDGSLTFADLGAGTYYDFTAPVTWNQPAGVGVVSTSDGSSATLSNLTQLAMTGMKLVSAWNAAGNPAPRVGTSATRVNANGTLTQTVNGRSGTAPMPVGTPYLAANGSLITNNGDGTYTTVTSGGQVTTSKYGTSGSLGALLQNPLAIGGAAVLAILLLKKRG